MTCVSLSNAFALSRGASRIHRRRRLLCDVGRLQPNLNIPSQNAVPVARISGDGVSKLSNGRSDLTPPRIVAVENAGNAADDDYDPGNQNVPNETRQKTAADCNDGSPPQHDPEERHEE